VEFLQWIAAAVVMVGVLVVIHELGHWLVARFFGVGTPEFAVGVGPRIASFTWLETEFRLNLLPIGGYVRMSGADPFGEESASDWVPPEQDFMQKPVWQRLLIMLAGPAMNLALPFVLFTAVMMLGEPQLNNVVGTIYPTGRAEAVGLQVGDRIVSAGGEPVDTWSDLTQVLADHAGQPLALTVDRGGQTLELQLPGEAITIRADGIVDRSALGFSPMWRSTLVGVPDPNSPAGKAGLKTGDAILAVGGIEVKTWEALERALLSPGTHTVTRARLEGQQVVRQELQLVPDPSYQPGPAQVLEIQRDTTLLPLGLEHPATYVGTVQEGSAAERAGLAVGDRILSIDGTPVIVWSDVLRLVARTTAGGTTQPRELELALLRDGKPVVLKFAPTYEDEIIGGTVNYRPIMGVTQYIELEVVGEQVRKYYSFTEAFSRAVEEISLLFTQTMQLLGNLVGLNIWPTEAMGGPVAIIRVAGESAKQGLFSFARVMAMISFSLGIVNLLPVPVLDGGQIVFYSIEWIRGRPLPLSWRERIQMVGVLGILALLVWVTVNDVRSWLGG
jgi:regulator of sigma E protease